MQSPKQWPGLLVKISLAFFIIFFLNDFVFAQPVIKGKIINAENHQAVSGASVFISNTSKGTVSNSAGDFILSEIPSGQHELVVSSIGYETFVQTFSGDALPLELNVVLKLKIKELEGVTVVPFEKDGWEKWGKVFLENFIGTTGNSDQCTIKNYKSIRFRFLKEQNKLVALSAEPLVIINKALGYRIQYQLEEFQVDYQQNSMVYLGYPLFEELGSKIRFRKNREKAFHGSVMNFIRSLCDNKLQEEGFDVVRLKKLPNTEKVRVKEIYKPVKKTKKNEKTGEMMTIIDYDYERLPKDSVSYYERVLRQKDYFDLFGDSLLTADSLVVADTKGTKYLDFRDYIYVTYRKGKEELKYLQSIMESNRKPFYQRSSAVLAAPVTIEPNGNYYSPQHLFTLGYWGWSEKIADMLPFDYSLKSKDTSNH